MELAITLALCIGSVMGALVTRLYLDHKATHGTFVLIDDETSGEKAVGIKFNGDITDATSIIVLHKSR